MSATASPGATAEGGGGPAAAPDGARAGKPRTGGGARTVHALGSLEAARAVRKAPAFSRWRRKSPGGTRSECASLAGLESALAPLETFPAAHAPAVPAERSAPPIAGDIGAIFAHVP